MLTLYLNTITGDWFDADGNLFRNGSPSLSFHSREQVRIIVCTDTLADSPADWVRDTSYAGFNQCSALITADNDYIQHLKGELAVAITAGSVDSVQIKFPASVTLGLLPTAGTIRLFNAAGNYEALDYTARELTDAASNTFTFDTTGLTVEDSYAVGAVADSTQAPYCEAFMDFANSNLAQGVFAFELVADSYRIREATDYGNVATLPITGLEFLPFYIDSDTAETIILKKYLLGTFALTGIQGNPNSEGEIPDATINKIAAAVGAQMAEGIQAETRTIGDDTQMRIWSVAGGEAVKSDWLTLPRGAIVTGAGEIEFTVAAGTVTFAGSTVTQVIADNAIHFSGGTAGILAALGNGEYDLIDGDGVNVTTDPAIRRQWSNGDYVVTMLTGWADGSYALKPCGIKGEKGDKGDPGSGAEYTAGAGITITGSTIAANITSDGQGLVVVYEDTSTHAMVISVSPTDVANFLVGDFIPNNNSTTLTGSTITAAMDAETYHVATAVSSLTLTGMGYVEATIAFTLAADGVVDYPPGWGWAKTAITDTATGLPNFEGGKPYIISVNKGLAVAAEYTPATGA